jgi:hypothetical protein
VFISDSEGFALCCNGLHHTLFATVEVMFKSADKKLKSTDG